MKQILMTTFANVKIEMKIKERKNEIPYKDSFQNCDLLRLLYLLAHLSTSLFVTGCGFSSSGTYTITTDSDWFEKEINGRTIGCRNWIITVDDKKIPIEKKKSIIRIDTAVSGKVDVFVNGKQVHDE